MSVLPLTVALSLVVATCQAGTIVGVVKAQGKAGAQEEAAGGKYSSRKYKFLERVNYEELRDFIVYIDQPVTNAPSTPPRTVQVVTQKDGMFKPHVLPVTVGTKVEWPNYDDIFHNVFSISETKEFDLGLYKDPRKGEVVFDKTGRVDVFCSIHTKMHCIILVLPNPYFATANAQGKYTITNVPPGTYKLKAWHERMPSQTREIAVPAEGETRADFLLTFPGQSKP